MHQKHKVGFSVLVNNVVPGVNICLQRPFFTAVNENGGDLSEVTILLYSLEHDVEQLQKLKENFEITSSFYNLGN